MEKHYDLLIEQAKSLIEDSKNFISSFANVSALLFDELGDVNWVGFYLVEDNILVLGPFQGKIACSFIPYGKGVCGTCLEKKQSIVVEDVHKFAGHIACDSRSNSEIVIPLFKRNDVFALLDIDSELFARFDNVDLAGLEKIVKVLEESL